MSLRILAFAMAAALACSAPPRDQPAPGSPPGTADASPDTVAARAVRALRAETADSFVALVHPEKGVRFTPYTHVDSATDRRFTRDALRAAWRRPDSLLWGAYDGSGEPMRLSLRQYLDKFGGVFPAGAPLRIARDSEPMGTGNSLNNIRAAYPRATIIEYHTDGHDPRYGGMDWRSLWIVMEMRGSEWYVTGVVHGSWTT